MSPPNHSATSSPPLVVENLSKTFRRGRSETTAVAGLSFELGTGRSLGIVGESGSGKTTTARMLMGLETPTSGRILLGGVDHTKPARGSRRLRERGRRIQIVFQDPYTSLDRHQTIRSCLAEVVRIHTGATRQAVAERVDELAQLVGLDERQLSALPSALSGGQRQRVAIARALASEAEILILDEAVSALDVSIQAQILNLLASIREQRTVSYVFISHDLAVIRQVADDTIVMRAGRVVESGPTAQVLDHPQHPYTRLLRDSIPHPGWSPVSHHTGSLSLTPVPSPVTESGESR